VFLDKARLAQVLDRLELPHPRTVFPLGAEVLEALSEEAIGQVFLKPRCSQAFARQYGAKAFRFETRAEALALVSRALQSGHELMLQEYLPGPPSCHYFIDGFVDAGGVLRASFARQRLRMHPPDFGNSTYLMSVRADEVGDAAQSVERLLSEVGYRGVFSAEFKYDQRDGRFKLLEVNARPWWYVEFAARCGVNVCAMAYRDALGLPVASVETYAVGRRCVYPQHDRVVGLRLWREGRLSLWSLARSWLGASQAVLCWDDPLPGAASFAIWLRDGLRRRPAA
jgi:predicted ATP-grasp superfamily ATP-dependent carboligase